jgi:hypothetical protein
MCRGIGAGNGLAEVNAVAELQHLEVTRPQILDRSIDEEDRATHHAPYLPYRLQQATCAWPREGIVECAFAIYDDRICTPQRRAQRQTHLRFHSERPSPRNRETTHLEIIAYDGHDSDAPRVAGHAGVIDEKDTAADHARIDLAVALKPAMMEPL